MSCYCFPSGFESLQILVQPLWVPLAVVSSGDASQEPRCYHHCQAASGPLERLSPVPVWCSPLGLEATAQLQAGEESDGDAGCWSQDRKAPCLAGPFCSLFTKYLLATYGVPNLYWEHNHRQAGARRLMVETDSYQLER